MIKDSLKALLLDTAKQRSGNNIAPCSGLPWDKCYRVIGNNAALYYNDSTGSTRLVLADIHTGLIILKPNIEGI